MHFAQYGAFNINSDLFQISIYTFSYVQREKKTMTWHEIYIKYINILKLDATM